MTESPSRRHGRPEKMMQVTIFGASSEDLLKRGVDIEACLSSLGYTSTIVDLDIPYHLSSTPYYDSEAAVMVEDNSAIVQSPDEVVPDLDISDAAENENALPNAHETAVQMPAPAKRGRSRSRTRQQPLQANSGNKKRRGRPKSVPAVSNQCGVASSCQRISSRSPKCNVRKKRNASVGSSKQRRTTTTAERCLSSTPELAVQKKDSTTTEEHNALSTTASPMIACAFPGCKRQLNCLRGCKGVFSDHARIHWRKSTLQCHHCDAVFFTRSRYYYHYQKFHKGEKPGKPLDVLSENDRREFWNVWLQCFPNLPFPTM